MPLHDAYARLTPFEIAFPDREPLLALASAVADEAETRAVDASALDAFLALAAVGELLAELHGAEAPRVALLEYGTLAYHAVHFLQAGTPLFLLTTAATRELVAGASRGAPEPPSRAGYVQLPQHLLWARGGDGAPESVDGAFWTVSAEGRLHVLPVTGVRPDRPGFGTLTVPDAPLAHAAEWARATVRESGDDYASDLPGAQFDRLHAIQSVGEVLKLMARFFARVAGGPAPVRALAPSHPLGPSPSALPYARID